MHTTRSILRPAAIIVLAATALLVALPSAAQYVSGPKVDARELEVGGVQLGMSVEEAVAAIAERYDIETSAITIQKSGRPHAVLEIALPIKVLYASVETDGFRVGTIGEGWEISVSFVARVPFVKEDPVGAWRIEYQVPWTAENVETMVRAANGKYGEPTADSYPVQWCDRTANWASCESDAKLSLSGTTLTLEDASMLRAEREALAKARGVKPRF